MTVNRLAINEVAANKIWDLFVADLNVYNDAYGHERSCFVYAMREGACMEWRIQGVLGFGGKFRPGRWTVDCYPEDETPGRRALIDATNMKLAKLQQECGT